MAYRQQNFDIVYGIVCGGDDKDPDPSRSGGFRVWIPGQYGQNVKREDLPFARGAAQATQEGVTRFNPPPERGTGVILAKRTGESGTGEMIALGTMAGEMGGGQGTPGNYWLNDIIKEFTFDHEVSIRERPKGVKETTDKGAKVLEPKESGEKWKNQKHFGMLTSTALPPILTMGMENMKNVMTAKTPYANMITSAMQGGLPGSFMDITSLFDKMSDSDREEITNKLTPDLQLVLQNMLSLLQSVDLDPSDGFTAGTRINEEVFIANAVALFKDTDIQNIGDIIDIFNRLMNDPELWGCELLQEAVNLVTDAFGVANVTISGCGNDFSIEPSEESQKAAQALSSLMSSAGSFPSVMPGENFFGGSAQSMQEMLGRLTPEQMKIGMEQLQKHVAPGTDPRAKLNNALKAFFSGDIIMG